MVRPFQLVLCVIALVGLVLPLTFCPVAGLATAAQVDSPCGHAMPANPSPRIPPCCVAHTAPRVALTAQAHDPKPAVNAVSAIDAVASLAYPAFRPDGPLATFNVVPPPGFVRQPLRI